MIKWPKVETVEKKRENQKKIKNKLIVYFSNLAHDFSVFIYQTKLKVILMPSITN